MGKTIHTSDSIRLFGGKRIRSVPLIEVCAILAYPVIEEGNHAFGIHRFTSVELEIFEVGNNFLGVCRCSLFKGIDTFGVRLPEFTLYCFHVTLEISQIGFLVE